MATLDDAGPPHHDLPAPLTPFVGRRRELAEAHALVDGNRLVTLTGVGGCGKTRLALELAAGRADRHPGGVWFVELAGLDRVGRVDRQVAAALGLAEEPGRTATEADAVAAAVGRRDALLVLDNCEHVVDGVASLVADLLGRCAGLRVLTTSRQVLGVAGEVVWRVPSMSLDDDAVQLFVERAGRARPDFRLDDDSAPTVAAICRRLDGIPLALELAAARVRTIGLAEIEAGLDDRFRLLTGGGRTLLPRHQTLRASVDWSYEVLDDDEQRLFRRLAAFAGAFTLGAAGAVGGDDLDVREVLASLVDRSLVQVDAGGREARYRYLETMKEYGRSQLASSDEESAVRDRHLHHHLEVAEAAFDGLAGADQARWLEVLDER